MSNLFSLFQQNFPNAEHAPFLIDSHGRVISYGEMQQQTAQIARQLQASGLKKGDRIAVQLHKSPEVLMIYLASLRAGLIYLPLNNAYTDAEMAYFIEDAQPSLLLCDPSRETGFGELLKQQAASTQVMSIDAQGHGLLIVRAHHQQGDFYNVTCSDDDLAAILYTSGTTGRPKGVMLSHGNLAANAFTLKAIWGFTAADVLIHALPIFHVHGLFVACHCVMAAGASMLFQPNFDATQVASVLPKASVLMGVPTFYTRLLADAALDVSTCQSIRLFISGSAPLLATTHKDFEVRTGHKILERYGMTETGMLVSNPLAGERRAGTVGSPLPEVLVRIVTANDSFAQCDEIGSIQVQGPNVFKGYWRKPEKTAEEFTEDGYFITGDQGKISDDGYISIVGRAKDMVITGGFNVYPKEVERVLDAVEGVKETAVIGLPHKDFGEAVTAIVVLEGGDVTEQEVIAQAKCCLAAFKVPKKLYFVKALPRNTMGKVQKNVLRERFVDGCQ
ncbi:MAG: malonyl-CoA/methylmalonyl-CoA synthetase [Pseudohongiellaceae bacterium]|jgi:malonyl-CoA/methylmalonyl-CoA synthetase